MVVVGVKDPDHDQGEFPFAFVEIDLVDYAKKKLIREELHGMYEEKVIYYSVPVEYVFCRKLS